jgi:hypothetical protein
MTTMTKAQIKKALHEQIDCAWNASKGRIESMQSESHNPQVKAIIDKNRGYMLAMEDVTDMLYGLRLL